MSDDPSHLLSAAMQEHRDGNLDAATEKYRRILDARPDHWDALYLYGAALLQLGAIDEALAVFARCEELRPGVPDVLNNLGVARQAKGDWEQAARSYEAALKARPEYDRPLFNLGRLMESRGLLADAEKCLRHAVDLNPNGGGYRQQLAEVLGRQEKWDDVERLLRQASQSDPNNLDLQVNLGYALVKLERLDDAAEIYRGILKQRRDYAEVHASLAFVLERKGDLTQALLSARRAVEFRPDYADGFNNLGVVLRSLQRLDDACRSFERALARKPDFPLAEFNLGTTHLLAGEYRQGWKGYRAHARLAGLTPPGPPDTEWDGRPIPGATLLVYADQGFGDAIQFARFLRSCKRQSQARVVFRVQPALLRLFTSVVGADAVVSEEEALPHFDFHVPLASLPGLFDATLETVAQEVPYLAAPNSLSPALQALIGTRNGDERLIGLVWRGNPKQARDVLRSCPLDHLLPLLEVEGARFFSLQVEQGESNRIGAAGLGDRLTDLGPHLADFADTAAALSQLDLLITVDTSVGHLAGALGRPVWTLLCYAPDWRWHLDRDDSPWYPTMRLFRQAVWGDWPGVVTQVRGALLSGLGETEV